jgi:hypothetical protein
MHESPYTYFTSKELHLGEISLECSRAGAAAVALWATQQLLPLREDGEFARGLSSGRRAAVELDRMIRGDARFEALAEGGPELDIVVWKPVERRGRNSSKLAREIFVACATRDLHLALVQLPQSWFRQGYAGAIGITTCFRSVLMKPEHADWVGRIWERYCAACGEVLGE